MRDLGGQWSKAPKPHISERVHDMVRPPGALKPRIQSAVNRLHSQVAKLDTMLESLQKRDAQLFSRIVEATQKQDAHTSRVLGAELAEIRKVTKILGGARTVMDRIEIRLTTCKDLGDTVVAIMPTVGLMRNLKSSLEKVLPGAGREIEQMASMLGGFMTESFVGDTSYDSDLAASAEAEKILQEAAAVAGSSADQKFPSVPASSEKAASVR